MHVGLGTDIGGGTSFSLLATMGAAYEIAQLGGRTLSAVEAFYLATLGGARALALDDRIGTIAPGREADLVVLDPSATPLIGVAQCARRLGQDRLFAADDDRRRSRGARDLCGRRNRPCGQGCRCGGDVLLSLTWSNRVI